ncbi:MAG: hypothetical protein ACP5SH_27345 [Syntrophobacteraceae bacterium]
MPKLDVDNKANDGKRNPNDANGRSAAGRRRRVAWPGRTANSICMMTPPPLKAATLRLGKPAAVPRRRLAARSQGRHGTDTPFSKAGN